MTHLAPVTLRDGVALDAVTLLAYEIDDLAMKTAISPGFQGRTVRISPSCCCKRAIACSVPTGVRAQSIFGELKN